MDDEDDLNERFNNDDEYNSINIIFIICLIITMVALAVCIGFYCFNLI